MNERSSSGIVGVAYTGIAVGEGAGLVAQRTIYMSSEMQNGKWWE